MKFTVPSTVKLPEIREVPPTFNPPPTKRLPPIVDAPVVDRPPYTSAPVVVTRNLSVPSLVSPDPV